MISAGWLEKMEAFFTKTLYDFIRFKPCKRHLSIRAKRCPCVRFMDSHAKGVTSPRHPSLLLTLDCFLVIYSCIRPERRDFENSNDISRLIRKNKSLSPESLIRFNTVHSKQRAIHMESARLETAISHRECPYPRLRAAGYRLPNIKVS
jgi:hypothetical protein